MRRLLVLLAMVPGVPSLLACAGLLPSEPATDPPAEAPLDLPAGIVRLEAQLEPIREAHGVPALGAAVVRGSELVAIGAVGERAAGSGRAVTVSDRWHVGSVTKSMTATVIARHVARGELAWDTPVAEVFTGVEAHPGWQEVRLADLLHHRAGPPEIGAMQMSAWLLAPDADPHELRRRWVVEEALPAEPKPGPFAYSNSGYVIAGAMLEEVTGQTWQDLLRAELFEPLGMERAGFGAPEGHHQPWGHRDGALGRVAIPPGPGADNPAPLGPAGTVHATLPDLARYAAAHLAMARGEAPWDDPVWPWLHEAADGEDYAAGWVVDGDRIWHNGSNTMWYALIELWPARDLAVITVTNVFERPAAEAASAAVRAELPAVEPDPSTPEPSSEAPDDGAPGAP